MSKYAIAFILFAAMAGASFGGFKAGSAYTADHYQRIALSRQFGALNQKTLEFEWADAFVLTMPKAAK